MKSAAFILQSMGFANPAPARPIPPKGHLKLAAPRRVRDAIQRHTQGALDYLVATLRSTW